MERFSYRKNNGLMILFLLFCSNIFSQHTMSFSTSLSIHENCFENNEWRTKLDAYI